MLQKFLSQRILLILGLIHHLGNFLITCYAMTLLNLTFEFFQILWLEIRWLVIIEKVTNSILGQFIFIEPISPISKLGSYVREIHEGVWHIGTYSFNRAGLINAFKNVINLLNLTGDHVLKDILLDIFLGNKLVNIIIPDNFLLLIDLDISSDFSERHYCLMISLVFDCLLSFL